jgi:hypothetical protein
MASAWHLLFVIRASAQIIAGGHGKPIGDEIGDPEHEQIGGDSSAPATPDTIANVVTAPPMSPHIQSRR